MKYTIKLFKFLGYLAFALAILQVINLFGIFLGAVWCYFSLMTGIKIIGASITSTIITQIFYKTCKYAGDEHIKSLTNEADQRLSELLKETE